MFRHHKPGTEVAPAEPGTAAPEDEGDAAGAQAEGVVLRWEDTHEKGKRTLHIGVTFDDGETVEFEAHASDYLHIPEQVRREAGLAHDDDLVVLGLVDGAKVPVRYDPSDRQRVVLDEAALHRRALERHITAQRDERARMAQRHRGV